MGIQVMLADDQRLVLELLRNTLKKELDIDVVEATDNGYEVLERCGRSQPDVVVMDINRGKPDGIEIAKQLRCHHPAVKVVALSRHTGKRFVVKALEAGVSGYVSKTSPVKALLNAIRAVHSNQSYFCQEVADALIDAVRDRRRSAAVLGRREVEILTQLAEGKHTQEIGDILSISAYTVEAHRRNIMRKLDLHNIVALTKYALREGLVEL